MSDQWRHEKRGDFGWYVEGETEIKAFWLVNAVFIDPSAKVSGKIAETTARVLEEMVAKYSVEISPYPNLSSAMHFGELTAFSVADNLGGGYMIVLPDNQLNFQSIGIEKSSHPTSSSHSEGNDHSGAKLPFWKRLFGFGKNNPQKLSPTDYAGTSGIFRDNRDNREYQWVRIGKQIWMAENLHYSLRQGCWKNDNDGITTYYYSRKSLDEACPAGWRAPEKEDFEELIATVGGEDEASIQLREGGNSGFEAVANGRRYDDGSFTNTDTAYFWAANDRDQLAWFMEVYPDRDDVTIRETWDEGLKSNMGTTIRCIRK